MPQIAVDGLVFLFPDGWEVSKYDDWVFYRKQFQRSFHEAKAVDLLAIEPARSAGLTVWFIEVKDYRNHPSTRPSELPREIARKVQDTLSALLPASVNANESSEAAFARKVNSAMQIRVVLHLEQPSTHSRLFPRTFVPADIAQKLKGLIKAVNAHPKVCEQNNMRDVHWTVS